MLAFLSIIAHAYAAEANPLLDTLQALDGIETALEAPLRELQYPGTLGTQARKSPAGYARIFSQAAQENARLGEKLGLLLNESHAEGDDSEAAQFTLDSQSAFQQFFRNTLLLAQFGFLTPGLSRPVREIIVPCLDLTNAALAKQALADRDQANFAIASRKNGKYQICYRGEIFDGMESGMIAFRKGEDKLFQFGKNMILQAFLQQLGALWELHSDGIEYSFPEELRAKAPFLATFEKNIREKRASENEKTFREIMLQEMAPNYQFTEEPSAEEKRGWLAKWSAEAERTGTNFMTQALALDLFQIIQPGLDITAEQVAPFLDYLQFGEFVELPLFFRLVLNGKPFRLWSSSPEEASLEIREAFAEAKALSIYTKIKNLDEVNTPALQRGLWDAIEKRRVEFAAQVNLRALASRIAEVQKKSTEQKFLEKRRQAYLDSLLGLVRQIDAHSKAAANELPFQFHGFLHTVLQAKDLADPSETMAQWREALLEQSSYSAARAFFLKILQSKSMDFRALASKPEATRNLLAEKIAAQEKKWRALATGNSTEYLGKRREERELKDLRYLQILGDRLGFFANPALEKPVLADFHWDTAILEKYRRALLRSLRNQNPLLQEPKSFAKPADIDLVAEIQGLLGAGSNVDNARLWQIVDKKLLRVKDILLDQVRETAEAKSLDDLDLILKYSQGIQGLLRSTPGVSDDFLSYVREVNEIGAGASIWNGFFNKYISYVGGGLMLLHGVQMAIPWILPRWAVFLELTMESLSPYLLGYNLSAMAMIAGHIGFETYSYAKARKLRREIHEMAGGTFQNQNAVIGSSEDALSQANFSQVNMHFLFGRGMDGFFLIGIPLLAKLKHMVASRWILRWVEGAGPRVFERDAYFKKLFANIGFIGDEFSWDLRRIADISEASLAFTRDAKTRALILDSRRILALEVARVENKLARISSFYRSDFEALGMEPAVWNNAKLEARLGIIEQQHKLGAITDSEWNSLVESAVRLQKAQFQLLYTGLPKSSMGTSLYQAVLSGKLSSKDLLALGETAGTNLGAIDFEALVIPASAARGAGDAAGGATLFVPKNNWRMGEAQ